MEYKPNEDIFESNAELIINPVNCHAHMLAPGKQKGLAHGFEVNYPSIQENFKKVCKNGTLKPGYVQVFGIDRATGNRVNYEDASLFIANLATKDHWRDRSRIEWVDTGLGKLAGVVRKLNIKSVAIPKLGAGFGKLPWKDVRQCIEKHFRPLSEDGVKVIVLGEGPEKEEAAATGNKNEALEKKSNTKFYAGIGARKTPENELRKMKEIAKILAKAGIVLRSGGAVGADSAFEKGCNEVDPGLKEIYLPWNGFDPAQNGNPRYADNRVIFADQASSRHLEMARKYHPNFDKLGRGGKALMARNGSQMLGRNMEKASDFVVCWTKNGKEVGGTGQAIRMAEDLGIKTYNIGSPELKHQRADTIAMKIMKDAGIKAPKKETKENSGNEFSFG